MFRLLIIRQPAENIAEPQKYSFDQIKNPGFYKRGFYTDPVIPVILFF